MRKLPLLASSLILVLASCDSVSKATAAVDEVAAAKRQATKAIEGQIAAAKDSVSKYTVMAQSTLDSAVAFVEVATDGKFRLDSIGGKPISEAGSLVLSVLDGEHNLAGVISAANSIALKVDSLSDSVAGGVARLGKFSISSSSRSIVLPDSVAKMADSAYRVVTQGVDDLGATATASALSDAKAVLDRDHDGVPDLLDADNDNDGILDELDDGDSASTRREKLPGDVIRFIRDIRVNTVFLPIAGAPPQERANSYILQMRLHAVAGAAIDSIVVDGPSYLDSCSWKIIAPQGTIGDNRLNGNVRRLSKANTSEGWHAEISSNQGILFRKMRAGDVIVFRVHSGAKVYRAVQAISWMFRDTPKLIRYADGIGYDRLVEYADSVRKLVPTPGSMPWKPALRKSNPAKFQITLLKLRTPLRDSVADSLASIASLAGFQKDNRYMIEFWTHSATRQLQMRRVEGPVRLDAASGDSIGFRFHPLRGTAEVFIPASYLRDTDTPNGGGSAEDVVEYKADLSMWDRLDNKTSLQVLFKAR